MANKVAVVAVGGNSLIKDKYHQSVKDQLDALYETSLHICDMIENGYNVVITHGNGPQVGFILLRSEMSRNVLHTVPMDNCGADTQGSIGYGFQQSLFNIFKERKIDKSVATVITQVLVDKNDPGFLNPTKPIGPFYSEEEAKSREKEEGWNVINDAGRGWRRVVSSPLPIKIVEEDAIRSLIESGFIVIGVGGGGIPVIKNNDGLLKGCAAVIDKDHASSLLASNINADLFVVSTAVEKVSINFGEPDQQDLNKVSLKEAKKYCEEGHFKPGSMLPKIKSVISFLEKGGKKAVVTCPERLKEAIIDGTTGTHFYV